ncbi:MFS transporter [Neobacillus mesonae]|uniref:MFS transporter n=1 Tax=Neobacillus mesonae TaxID=1193713 RepID=UPI00203DD56C|nr:MFS transporter [Neobacillus mesonae]MCM3570652.1 MFS transporter [Neobacillus mesonae]
MWRNRNVWIILSGEFITGLGLWMGIIGNLEFMQDKLHSDFLKSLLLAVGILAGVSVGPYAGRLTDRTKKKTVMLIAGIVRVVSVVFMFIAIATGSIWWMAVFLVLHEISAAFYFPALQAAIPLIVDASDLLRLNGIHMNVSTLSRIIGTAAAGILVIIMPLSVLYASSLVAYIGLLILACFLNIDESKTLQQEQVSTFGGSNFKEIFPLIKALPIVFITLIMTLVPVLFLGGFNLIVINISEIQHNSAIKGWIYTAEGTFFMIGALFIKRISEKISPYVILFSCSLLIGLSQFLLLFAEYPVISVAAFVAFGFSVGCFFPTAATIFQTKVPKDFHGRFFSFRNMLDLLSYQIILLITGLLLDIIGLQNTCALFGGLSILITTVFFIRHKQFKSHNLRQEK